MGFSNVQCPNVPQHELRKPPILMQLDEHLTLAKTVSSMRQELWLTEADEGDPEYPTVGRVFGTGMLVAPLEGEIGKSRKMTNHSKK